VKYPNSIAVLSIETRYSIYTKVENTPDIKIFMESQCSYMSLWTNDYDVKMKKKKIAKI
jgi:hypothetical protein